MKAKRFFSLFLALALCLSMFPVSADGGVTEYNLWIGGTRVTSDNASDVLRDGTVSYDASENTLTLNGANITKMHVDYLDVPSSDNCAVYYGGTDNLTVNLIDDCSIALVVSNENYQTAFGFYSAAGVTFKGDGSLTVTAGDDTKKGNLCYGIFVKGKSVIDAGTTVKAVAKSATNYSYGFHNSDGLTVRGSLSGQGGSSDSESVGISLLTDMVVVENAVVIAEGGRGEESIGLYWYCEEEKNLIINGGVVKATGRSATANSSGIFVEIGSNEIGIVINDGDVTATGGDGSNSYGIMFERSRGKVTINAGEVKAIGYSGALNKAAVLGSGVTAGGSENVDGSHAGAYDPLDNDYYVWFKSPFDAPATFAIVLSPDSYYFGELSEGYAAPTPVTVTVTNTGTGDTGELSITLGGTNADDFICSTSNISNIQPETMEEFTVVPKTGLSVGNYYATVNITRANEIIGAMDVIFAVYSGSNTGDLGDTGGSGDTGVPGDTGYIGGSVDADDTAGSEGADGTDAFFTPIVEEVQKAEIGDNKNQEKIDVKTDKKKGTALVELKDTKGLSGKDIYVRIPKIKDVTTNILSVPVEKLSQKAHEGSITFETYLADIVLPSNMLTEAKNVKRNNAEISVAEIKKADLPIDVQKRIGNKPLVSFNLSIDNVAFRWNNKAAAVRVSIPYTPSEKELKNLDGITAYHVDDGGKLVEMEDARYDAKTKAVVFTTTHFSYYVVGYNENKGKQVEVEEELTFSDVNPGDWYYDAVKYIASKKITNGTGNGKFSPKAPLSRAQFIVMLMRSYGVEPDAANTDNFSDAGDTYYTNYLAAAKRLGIAKGVGDNKFEPETAISREAMFTLLYNALKVLDKLPTVDSGKTLSDFDDGAEVSDWAKEAVAEMVKNGTVEGFNNMLRPAEGSNRAEMAQLLYKLLSSN